MDVNKLSEFLKGCPDERFIIDGFTNGFALGVRETYTLSYGHVKPRPSPMSLIMKLKDEVTKGRIIGPFIKKPLQDLFISPLYVIPKPNSEKVRMIFNLSHPYSGSVNDNIDESLRSVHYCSVQDVGQCLVSRYGDGGAWLAKVDLADAYRIVPIRKPDWKFLGMYVEEEYYIDRMLPMGCSSSCQIFNRVSDCLKWMFYQYCPASAEMFNYLDDFLFIGGSMQECEAALSWFESHCDLIGVPIAPHKTVRPVKSLVFLGIGIDASNLSMYLPTEKKQKMLEKIESFLSKKNPQVKQWQSLTGSLNHVAQVVVSGRIYLSSLYGSLAGILSQRGNKRRSINEEVREDIKVWYTILRDPPERSFRVFRSESSMVPDIYTDASTSVGYGCVFGSQWFAGTWPPGRKCNIAVLELYPILVALLMLNNKVQNTAVNVYTDNHALVSILNRLYCKDPAIRRLMRPLVRLCMARNYQIVARHVPGQFNIGPDMLSRNKINEFKAQFPKMNSEPVRVPEELLPVNSSYIQWN